MSNDSFEDEPEIPLDERGMDELDPIPVSALEIAEPVVNQIMPNGFSLMNLLQFLPDPKLKVQIVDLAQRLLVIDVTDGDGLEIADKLRGELGDKIAEVEGMFDGTDANPGPTNLANQLHKRLTGLRADFTKEGKEAVKTSGERIYREQTAREQQAEKDRVEKQALADRATKVEAAAAAEEAKEAGAPPEVIKQLTREAKTATAPPVAVSTPAPLSRNSTAQSWKSRLVGCQLQDPHVEDLTTLSKEDQETARKYFRAVSDGKIPLSGALINWSYLNKRAQAEKSSMQIPHIETYDVGMTRRKGRR